MAHGEPRDRYRGPVGQEQPELGAPGAECDLTRSVFYYYIHDHKRPSPETLRRMCEVLEVTYEEGLEQVDPREPHRPAGMKPKPVKIYS